MKKIMRNYLKFKKIENNNFQKKPIFSSFGKIFPKLDQLYFLVYTYIRGENYDRKKRIS